MPENIEVGMIEVKVVPSSSCPEKAQLMVVNSPKKCRLPVLFERPSKSFLNFKFDSETLEKYYQNTSLHRKLYFFQFALVYVALSCIFWAIYVGSQSLFVNHWKAFLIGLLVLFILTLLFFLSSFTKIYIRFKPVFNIIFSFIIIIFSLLYFTTTPHNSMTLAGIFIGCMEIIILIYNFIPTPFFFSIIISIIYSIIIEIFFATKTSFIDTPYIIGRILLHLAVHLLAIHLRLTTESRQRSTFYKVGQTLKSLRNLAPERQFKQNMIHSLMPPKVAQEIMSAKDDEKKAPAPTGDSGLLTFRTFHMSKMEDVSILFADIVGFTKMSSNKSAEHLVSLLSDLFGRFDDICNKCGCEKISTLGDCYYCVSGCPVPKADHARCCVEMGLSMCIAIKQFDEDHKEEVNMRVGVHTGTVLCGLVGTRRFKFDVWSHDVTIANSMESEGLPGRVHISDPTYQFVKDDYVVEKGEPVPDIKGHKTLIECFDNKTQQYIVQHISKEGEIDTWFIVDRKPHIVPFVKDSELQVPMSGLTSHPPPSTDASNKEIDEKAPSTHLLTVANKESSEPLAKHLGTTEGDSELVECMKECVDLQNHLYRPPINRVTLNFNDKDIESRFRSHSSRQDPTQEHLTSTRSQAQHNNLFDLLFAVTFYLLVSVACIVVLHVSVVFWVVFAICLVLQLLLLILALLRSFSASLAGLQRVLAGWSVHHVVHLLLLPLPVVTVFAAFSCHKDEHPTVRSFYTTPIPDNQSSNGFLATQDIPLDRHIDLFYCIALLISILHFCNSTMVSSCYKNLLALISGIIFIIIVLVNLCYEGHNITEDPFDNTTTSTYQEPSAAVTDKLFIVAYPSLFSWISHPTILSFELILVVILLLLLIFFINHCIEIAFRLYYYAQHQEKEEKNKILKEKEQSDWLLHNIVPEHVANELKNNKSYCENHKEVGVIFAKISNFDDFYDESYEGGKEYLRVLNELMGDFEELFDLPQFKDVEKIKTIGSCLMAASGLNKKTRQQNKDPLAHLYALIDFAVSIIDKVEAFNQDIFNFNFEMKIGFNSGEVTAGVIGTEKLLYDIWGDTVNISSRMYSTGVHNKIQVTEDMAKKLGDKFDFEYRGQTFVKGKGDMNTYLLVKKKKGATWS